MASMVGTDSPYAMNCSYTYVSSFMADGKPRTSICLKTNGGDHMIRAADWVAYALGAVVGGGYV